MIVGIDPDIKKSGIAIINNNELQITNLSFFELFDFLRENRPELIILEAGWLNKKSNWHKGFYKNGKFVSNSGFVNEKISNKTGGNHETGRKIQEMFVYLGLNFELKKPDSKKVDTLFFEKLTGFKRSNQDNRDATMLIINRAKWNKKK